MALLPSGTLRDSRQSVLRAAEEQARFGLGLGSQRVEEPEQRPKNRDSEGAWLSPGHGVCSQHPRITISASIICF